MFIDKTHSQLRKLSLNIALLTLNLISLLSIRVNGQIAFGPHQIISQLTDGPTGLSSADLDSDGDMDVIVASHHGHKVHWYENIGNGNFAGPNQIASNLLYANVTFCADLDGDNDIDVVVTSYLSDLIQWHRNDGNGNFSAGITIGTGIEEPLTIFCEDLDGDGDIDVITAAADDGTVLWYENTGNGVFSNQNIITSDLHGASAVYSADFDLDGNMDVLCSSAWDDKILWFRNEGSGNFGSQNIILNDEEWPMEVKGVDIDGDSDIDVLASIRNINELVWFENIGNGIFSAKRIIDNNLVFARYNYPADLDLDGDLDVIGVSMYSDQIICYENNGTGNFNPAFTIQYPNSLASIIGADLDNDGDIDLVSSNLTDDKICWYENLHGEGCTDPTACNYDIEAFIENNSCCYGVCGCTDPQSASFNPAADCNDGTCTYRISGYVFYDENENSQWDDSEYGLPNQQVILHPQESSSLTNDEGKFSVTGPGVGIYTLELLADTTFPYLTTSNPVMIEVIYDYPTEDILFGVSNDAPLYGVCVDFYPPTSGYPCDDLVNHNICFRNEGNVPIDGIVEVQFDPLFQEYLEVTPIDSVSNDKLYMSFENLLPGQMFFYDVKFRTPTVEYIGENLTSFARISGFSNGSLVAYGEKEITIEMTCAYDPNDKHVFPNGYEDPHFILNDTELEYLIRFQNTGNASATNVIVTDTIDTNLDLSTFTLMANSHSVITSIHPDNRVIEFLFENIMLPDSGANEPESHGMISFKIKPYTALEPGTVLNNTGNIFFDYNPPVITNTTWNTIYNCEQSLATIEGDSIYCSGEIIFLENTQQYIEDYQWSNNNGILSEESVLIIPSFENAVTSVVLDVSNPLCSAQQTLEITIQSLPEATFIISGNYLIAAEGSNYQWFINGNPIADADSQVFEITQDGEYSVQVFNDFGCAQSSTESFVTYLGVESLKSNDLNLFPIPVERNGILNLTCSNPEEIKKIRIYDNIGKTVYESNSATFQIQIGDWVSGSYIMELTTVSGIIKKNLIVK